jgi:aldehyde:ferredoxin oxidoreductase
VNPFGADHQSSEHDPAYEEDNLELFLSRLEQLDLKNPLPATDLGYEKVRFVVYTQIFFSLLDTLELCQFVWGPSWELYGPNDVVELVRAVMGWDVSLFELMKVGERRLNMMRIFNLREGFDRKDDKLPAKFFRPLEGEGPSAGVALDQEELEAALDIYYQLLGWTKDGKPTRKNLVDLDLDWLRESVVFQ